MLDPYPSRVRARSCRVETEDIAIILAYTVRNCVDVPREPDDRIDRRGPARESSVERDLPSSHELLARLEAKISETRRALVEAAAAAGLQADQEAAYQRLIVALDELLSRIRAAIANESPPPLGPAPPRGQGRGQDPRPR